jgi:salicylate hydroxylase
MLPILSISGTMTTHVTSNTVKLSIIIVGDGPVGCALAAGLAAEKHSVTVLERDPKPRAEGGPLFVGRSGRRAYEYLGLAEALDANSLAARSMHWSYKDKKGEAPLTEKSVGELAARLVFRPAARKIAVEAALERGAVVLHDKKVVELYEDEDGKPRVVTADGQDFTADLIVAADGIKSPMRSLLFPDLDVKALPTPEVIFHAPLSRAAVRADPRIANNPLVADGPGTHFTMGPGILNAFSAADEPSQPETFVYSCILDYGPPPDVSESWYRHASADEMRRLLDAFPDKDKAALDLADNDNTFVWNIGQAPPVPSWRGKSGRVVLIGDAAHGMAPHLGQGLSVGLEDAISLCHVLRHGLASRDDLPRLTKTWEQFRRPRGDVIAKASLLHADVIMAPDGPAQEARDEMMRKRKPAAASANDGVVPDMHAPLLSPPFMKWLWEYDVTSELDKLVTQL